MIKTIRNLFAASAAHKTETENPDHHCLEVQGGGTG
jgi:hypothetical protein